MSDELLENLANLEHEQWSEWMEYLFNISAENTDGSVTIPADKVQRWKRQMLTSYSGLSEKEKESDRQEAKKVMGTIKDHAFNISF